MNVPLQFLQFASEAAEQGAKAEEAGGLAAFGLDPIAILLQGGAFVVLFILFRKFALKKVVGILDDRHQTIEESLENAKQIEASLKNAQKQHEEMLAESRREADKIITSAKNEGRTLVTDSGKKAVENATRMVQEAHNKIEQDVADARRDLQKEVKTLVADATEAILREKIDDKSDSALIDAAIKDASK